MSEVLYGKITAVETRDLGSEIVGSYSAGATVISLAETTDFNGDVGTVQINGWVYDYSGLIESDPGDEELGTDSVPGTISLLTGLSAAVTDGDYAYLYPLSVDKTALVTIEDGGDSLQVTVPHALSPLLDDGVRDEENQETVTMSDRNFELVIEDVVGRPAVIHTDAVAASDGDAPGASPTPTVTGGIGALFTRWDGIENNDAVTYEVHLSDVPDFDIVDENTPATSVFSDDFSGTLTAWSSVSNVTVASGRAKFAPVWSGGSGTSHIELASGTYNLTDTTTSFSVDTSEMVIGDGTTSLIIGISETFTSTTPIEATLNSDGLLVVTRAGLATVTDTWVDYLYYRFVHADGVMTFQKSADEENWITVTSVPMVDAATAASKVYFTFNVTAALTPAIAPYVYLDDFTIAGDPATTLVGTTSATSMSVKTLPNKTPLVYDTTYYVRIVATDSDGKAEESPAVSGMLLKASSDDISANYVYAGELLADQITGGTIQTDILVGGSLKTADSGARVELNAGGVVVYEPSGNPTTVLGSDGNSTFKGDAEINGLTVKTNSSFRGTANELSSGAELELAANTTAPSTAPTVVQTWDSINFTKSGDATFLASNITSITKVGSLWVCGYRDGTTYRVYRFNADGTYNSLGAPAIVSATASQTTQLVTDGYCYTIRTSDIVRHQILPSNYTYAFQDDFTSAVAGSRWVTQAGSVSWDSTSGGRAKLLASGGTDARIDTAWDKNFNDGYVYAKLIRSASSYTTQQMRMELYHTNNNEVARVYTEGTLLWFEGWNPTTNVSRGKTSITYSATTHAYWMIKEGAGTWDFYTSPDGSTWTKRYGIAHGLVSTDVDDLQIEFQSANAGGANQTVYVDEVRHGANNDDLVVPYTRVNTSQTPTIGNDGTNLLVAEYDPVNARYVVKTVSPTTLTVTATTNMATSSNAAGPLAGVLKGNFDFGASRYIFKDVGALEWKSYLSAGGTGSAQLGEFFSADNGGSKAIVWDGTNFQALGTDGKLYKHTSISLTSITTGSVVPYAAAFTWYDSNATGGTHETTISPVNSFTLKKRSKITVTSPAIPTIVGTDDINSIRVYMGATSGTLTLQSTTAAGVNSAAYNSLVTGASPPVAGNFPASVPAKIVSPTNNLIISGDGSIVADSITATTKIHVPSPVVADLVASGNLTPTTTTGVLVPGLTSTFTPPSASAVYLIHSTLDVSSTSTATAALFIGELFVDSTAEAEQILVRATAQDGRWSVGQSWIISGLSVASHTVQIRGKGQTGISGYVVNSTHSTLKILLLSY